MFGFQPHPDMMNSGFTPNNAAMLRLVALGEVKVVLIDSETLTKVSSAKHGPPFENLEYISQTLNSWDKVAIAKMAAAGVKMFHTVQMKGDLLFVPQGWLVVESSHPKNNLIYGVRKSFMVKDRVTYEHVKAKYFASSRSVDRMDKLLQLMKS